MRAEAQATGIADLHLEVRSSNEAVALYRAQGFEKVGESGDSSDTWTMLANL